MKDPENKDKKNYPTWIPKSLALELSGMSELELQRHIRTGKIRTNSVIKSVQLSDNVFIERLSDNGIRIIKTCHPGSYEEALINDKVHDLEVFISSERWKAILAILYE